MKSCSLLRSAAAAAVLLTAGPNTTVAAAPPREVWVATVTLMSQFGSPHDTVGDTVDERVDRVLEHMEEAAAYDPDIVCLTEIFPHAALRNLPPVPERAEAVPGPVLSRIFVYFDISNVQNGNSYPPSPSSSRMAAISSRSTRLTGTPLSFLSSQARCSFSPAV